MRLQWWGVSMSCGGDTWTTFKRDKLLCYVQLYQGQLNWHTHAHMRSLFFFFKSVSIRCQLTPRVRVCLTSIYIYFNLNISIKAKYFDLFVASSKTTDIQKPFSRRQKPNKQFNIYKAVNCRKKGAEVNKGQLFSPCCSRVLTNRFVNKVCVCVCVCVSNRISMCATKG